MKKQAQSGIGKPLRVRMQRVRQRRFGCFYVDSRVFFHSLFGCFFYGVFVTKMMLLTRKNVRPWVIPIVGGLLFFVLVYVWLTSALWFFQTTGVTF